MNDAFLFFLMAYWHQSSDIIFDSIKHAAQEFKRNENSHLVNSLIRELENLRDNGFFSNEYSRNYYEKFSKAFPGSSMIVTRNEVDLIIKELEN